MEKQDKRILAVVWFQTLKAYHEMKIAKHKMKISAANLKMIKRTR